MSLQKLCCSHCDQSYATNPSFHSKQEVFSVGLNPLYFPTFAAVLLYHNESSDFQVTTIYFRRGDFKELMELKF